MSHTAALVQRDVTRALDAARFATQSAADRTDRASSLHLRGAAQRIDRHADRLVARAPASLATAERHLDAVASRVTALDPVRVLERGYSITRDEHGRVVRTVGAVEPSDRLVTTVADGEITSEVVR